MLPFDFLYQFCILHNGVQQGSYILCNLWSLWCLVPWINRLPSVRWSSYWNSSLRQQLVCEVDIAENYFYIAFDSIYIYLHISPDVMIPYLICLISTSEIVLYFAKYPFTLFFSKDVVLTRSISSTSTGIDADATKGETSLGYVGIKLV